MENNDPFNAKFNVNFNKNARPDRYGADALGYAVVAVALMLMVVSKMTDIVVLMYAALAILALAFMRMYSKNITARTAENQRFLDAIKRFGAPFKTKAHDKNFLYLSCPECGQKVRVPKGKGTIKVSCPKCRHKFNAKS